MKRNSKITPPTTTSSAPADLTAARLVLRVPAYGARYGVSKRTVWAWLKIGLPHLKLSARKTRIPVQEADRWVEQNFLRQREG